MSSASILDSPSVSLYSIPAVWFSVYLPAFIKNGTIASHTNYDNVWPRGNIARLEKEASPDSELIARLKRADGAHSNGHETFPLYCAAILAANYSGVKTKTVNIASITYLSLRMLYNFVYINNKTQSQSVVRSATWMTSIGISLYLLGKSAAVAGSK